MGHNCDEKDELLSMELKVMVEDCKPLSEDQNPWNVSSIKEFQSYCCPECDVKIKSEELFANHARLNHPQSKVLIEPLEESDVEDYTCDMDIKQEEETFDLEALITPADADDSISLEKDKKERKTRPAIKAQKKKARKQKTKEKEEKDQSETQCYYCGEIMAKSQAVLHIRQVHGRRPNNWMHGPPRSHQCLTCKGMYTNETTLAAHQCYLPFKVNRGPDGYFRCHVCSKPYKIRTVLANHVFKEHDGYGRVIECPQCTFTTKLANAMRVHIRRTHNREINHCCPICGKGFFEKTTMEAHLHSSVHSGARAVSSGNQTSTDSQTEVFKCSACNEEFQSPRGLQAHINFKHMRPTKDLLVQCDQCSKKVPEKWKSSHIKMEHPAEEELSALPMDCTQCQWPFTNAEDLSKHVQESHDHSHVSYLCPICDLKVYGDQALLTHVAHVHKKFVMVCPQCSFVTKYQQLMAVHSRRHQPHGTVDHSVKFQCALCDQETTMNPKAHMRQRHNCFIACPVCGKTLEDGSDLEDHLTQVHHMGQEERIQISANDKKTTKLNAMQLCPHCGKSISSKANLYTHIKMVHGEKTDYVCDKCQFKTTNRGSFNRHYEIKHVRSQTFTCTICNKNFYDKGQFSGHMAYVHEKRRPIKCSQCDKGFLCNRDLNKHIARVHSTGLECQ